MSYVYSLPRSTSQGRQLDLDYAASLPRDRRQEGGKGSVNNIDQVSNDLPAGLTTARSGELIDSGSLRRRTLERPKKSSMIDQNANYAEQTGQRTLERQISGGDYRPTCETLEERHRSASNSRQNSRVNVSGQPEIGGQLDETLWANWEKSFKQLDQDLKRDSRPVVRRSETFSGPEDGYRYDSARDSQWQQQNNQDRLINGTGSRIRNPDQEVRQDRRRPSSSVSDSSWTQQTSRFFDPRRSADTYDSASDRVAGSRTAVPESQYGRITTTTHQNSSTEPESTIHRRFASESDNSTWIERQRRRLIASREMKKKQIEQERQSQTNLAEMGDGWSNGYGREQHKQEINSEDENRYIDSAQSRRGRSDRRETSTRRSCSFTADGGTLGGYRFRSLPRNEARDKEDYHLSKYKPDAHHYEYDDGGGTKSRASENRSNRVDVRMKLQTDTCRRDRINSDKASHITTVTKDSQQKNQRSGSFYKPYNQIDSKIRKDKVSDDTQLTLQPIGVKYLEPDEYKMAYNSSSLKRSATLGRTTKPSTADPVSSGSYIGLSRSQSSRDVKAESMTHTRQPSLEGERTFAVKPESFTRKPGSYTAKPEPYVDESTRQWTRVQTLPTSVQQFTSKPSNNTLQRQKNKNANNSENVASSHYANPELQQPASIIIPVESGSEVLSKSKSLQKTSLSSGYEIRRPIPISPKAYSSQISPTQSCFGIPREERRLVGSAAVAGIGNPAANMAADAVRVIPFNPSSNTVHSRLPNQVQPLERQSDAFVRESRTEVTRPVGATVRRVLSTGSNQQHPNLSNNQANSNFQPNYHSSGMPLLQDISQSHEQQLKKVSLGRVPDTGQEFNPRHLCQTQFQNMPNPQRKFQEFNQQENRQMLTSVQQQRTASNESSFRARENALADLEPFLKEFNQQEDPSCLQQPRKSHQMNVASFPIVPPQPSLHQRHSSEQAQSFPGSPNARLIDPTTRLTDPTTRIIDPTARIIDPTTRLIDPTTRLIDPTARLTDPTTRLIDPTARLIDPTARLIDPTARLIDPTARIIDPTARLTDPTTRLIDPTTRLIDPTARLTDPTTRLTEAQPVRVVDLRAEQRKQQATLTGGINDYRHQATDRRQIAANCDYQEPVSSRKVVSTSKEGFQERFASSAASNDTTKASPPTVFNHRINGPFKPRHESSPSSIHGQVTSSGTIGATSSQRMTTQHAGSPQIYESVNSAFSRPAGVRSMIQVVPPCGVIDPSLQRQPPDGHHNVTLTDDSRSSNASYPSAFQSHVKEQGISPERYIIQQQQQQLQQKQQLQQQQWQLQQQHQQRMNYQQPNQQQSNNNQQNYYQEYLQRQQIINRGTGSGPLNGMVDDRIRPTDNRSFTNAVTIPRDAALAHVDAGIQYQQQIDRNSLGTSVGPPPSCSSRDSLELETRFLSGSNFGFIPAGRSTPSASVDRSSGGSLWSSKDGIDTSLTGINSERYIRETYNLWYKPNMPRDQIVATLKTMEPGSFIVRDSSSYPGAFALAVKVAEVPANAPSRGEPSDDDLVRHFLIEATPEGVRLKGYKSEPAFESLASLIHQHTLTPIALPCKLTLPVPVSINGKGLANGVNVLDHDQGVAVLYIHSEDTGVLTGPEAIDRTISRALHIASPQLLLVHLKVSNDGITITDNSRKLFFRRHYPLQLITHCGFDRVQRRWTNTSAVLGREINARIFGFISRKMNDPMGSECHIFAELNPSECDPMVEVVSRIVEP